MIRRQLLLLCLLPALVFAADVVPRMLLLDGAVVGAEIVVVGERGTILRSADNGHSWTAVPSSTTAALTSVSFADDARHGWAAGHDALILASDDGGHIWQKSWQGGSLQDSLLDVLAIDARRAIAIGAYGLCLVTVDGGATWTRRKIIEEDNHLNRITRGPTGVLYIAGERGTLLRSTDAGATWTPLVAPYNGSFYGILPLDKRTLVAYGLRGRIFRSADDGATWETVATAQPVLFATALKLKSNFIVFAGQARALLVSRDYGRTVSTWPAPFTTAVAELIETPDGAVLALGEAGASLLPKP